jgi:hypothetical protein
MVTRWAAEALTLAPCAASSGAAFTKVFCNRAAEDVLSLSAVGRPNAAGVGGRNALPDIWHGVTFAAPSEPAGASAGSGWSDDAFRNARRMGEAGAKGDQPQDMVQAKQDPRRPEWAIAGRPQRLAMGGDARRIMDPLGRRRRQSGHRALQRGASERARGQVVRPSHLRHPDGTPVQSSLSRCSNSGSRAMLTAIRRAKCGEATRIQPARSRLTER